MIFPDDHPLKKFEKYYYLESGTRNIQVYIFRFTQNRGVIVWFVINDKDNGPHASICELIFTDDYNFNLIGKAKDIYNASFDNVVKQIVYVMEAILYGTIS